MRLREMPEGCEVQGEQNEGREVRRTGMWVRRREPGTSLSGVCSLPESTAESLDFRQGSYKSQICFGKKSLVSVGMQGRRPKPHSPPGLSARSSLPREGVASSLE